MWKSRASSKSAMPKPCWGNSSRKLPGFTMTTIASFFALYFTALLLLTGSGLFNTYMGLRLTASSVSELWVGGLIAVYYLGLVFGARIGHKLILRVGPIRAYAAMAALTTVTRSEERRVGHGCVRTCRSRWSPSHY